MCQNFIFPSEGCWGLFFVGWIPIPVPLFRVTNAKKHMGDIEEVQMIQIWGNKGGGGVAKREIQISKNSGSTLFPHIYYSSFSCISLYPPMYPSISMCEKLAPLPTPAIIGLYPLSLTPHSALYIPLSIYQNNIATILVYQH